MAKSSKSKFFIGSLVIVFILFLITQAILASALSLGKSAVKPVNQVENSQTGEQLANAGSSTVKTDVKHLTPGEKVVKQVCSRCHRSGLMRSPKLGKVSDWAPRVEKGVDKLYYNAINGFNKMPARGGRKSLTDEKIIAAVDHMISELK